MREGLRRSDDQRSIAQQTMLGWIVSGTVNDGIDSSQVSSHQCTIDTELGLLVRKFWEQEESTVTPAPLTDDEQRCEVHYQSTHSRTSSGRYVVRLPVSPTLPVMNHTRHSAVRLLAAMERKFGAKPEFRDQYQSFMREYERLQHMTPVPTIGEDDARNVCYLPHHGVIKEASTSTKLRVVFNGSQHLPSGDSLNDHLLVGPNLLPSLADILLRWRRHRFALATDVEKMYRQVQVHPLDRDLQRIVWRYSQNEDVKEYALNTVTYGLACAPFLAIRTLRQLADDEEERWPKGAAALRHDIYVDDVLTGADTQEEALDLQTQLISICMAGGFPLRKWAANSRTLLHAIPAEHRMQQDPRSWQAATQPTLGLQWHPQEDSFSFVIKPYNADIVTKRVVLSETARLFDPLGWLAPTVIHAKILLQSTWLQHLNWDAPLEPTSTQQWQQFREELPCLMEIRIPRWIHTSSSQTLLELHGFSDASERAYAAVVYLKASTREGMRVTLLLAKSKVAPIKQLSLPRLELCAATLLSKLVAHARDALSPEKPAITLWSDSTVAISWIRGHPSRWRTYVANRVSEIQRTLPDAPWRHVPSADNPADCASRGLTPIDLPEHKLWWHGPAWLSDDRAAWPQQPPILEQAPEERRTAHAAATAEPEESSLLLRFSSLHRLLRVTAWCLRWHGHRPTSQPQARSLQRTADAILRPDELGRAETHWIRSTQTSHFKAELDALRKHQAMSVRSTLAKLRPFLDVHGLLRVGGRLKHSLLSYDESHPVILPPRSHLTNLVIEAYHKQTLHGGVQTTLGSVRQRYWIPRGRSEVKRHIHRCVTCVRWRAASPQPTMSDLPKPRVTPSRPFTHTGVDYAGPIRLRTSKGRGQKSTKAFIAVFVCLSTRAVHLEAVSDYTAAAFLAAFRRFASRRGLCRDLYSDCGTNFLGADNQLRSLFQASNAENRAISAQLANDRVNWHFNPPAAPHFGGLWEAAVKSLKHHLRRVIGETTLTFEEMATFLAQVEACLNSRPLQPLSDDPDDVTALTPGHFLVGSAINAVPQPMADLDETSPADRWQLVQRMRDHFWQRWSQEYLQGLTTRSKWWKDGISPPIGSLCLIRNDASPPTKWPLARITAVHPGSDGHTRVVSVRTAQSELTRPLVKIVPLLPDSTGRS